MPEITQEEKVKFLKHLFPNPFYSYQELAIIFSRNVRTVGYWVLKYDVPTFKMTGSPFIMQDNLVNMLLKADKKTTNEDSNVGLEYCIVDIKSLHGPKKS